jgi:hypothetical protein
MFTVCIFRWRQLPTVLVGADRDDRLHVEDQDQHRGHQRAPADAGHADQDADAKAEDDDCRVHH